MFTDKIGHSVVGETDCAKFLLQAHFRFVGEIYPVDSPFLYKFLMFLVKLFRLFFRIKISLQKRERENDVLLNKARNVLKVVKQASEQGRNGVTIYSAFIILSQRHSPLPPPTSKHRFFELLFFSIKTSFKYYIWRYFFYRERWWRRKISFLVFLLFHKMCGESDRKVSVWWLIRLEKIFER